MRSLLEQMGELSEAWLQIGTISNDPCCNKQLSKLIDDLGSLSVWSDFCRCMARAKSLGLQDFINALWERSETAAQCKLNYEVTVLESVVRTATKKWPVLRSFTRQRHEKTRQRFQQLDKDLLIFNRRAIASQASGIPVPAGNSSGRVGEFTELGLIRNEIAKTKRFCRIRELFRRAGAAVQALKPCLMMSPLSVAQFLPPGSIKFDLVLMDEASQIKPEDAFGVIARAKQIVIVGDSKQLPPTNFFNVLVDGEDRDEDEMISVEDSESILDATAKVLPNLRRLKWHYRSKHESLIAFSNEHFYEGDLIVFPSPTKDGGQLGIRYHKVENAFFENGVNIVEATTVAKAIVEHAITKGNETLGVGTFNAKQRDAIENELERICMSNSEARYAVEALSQNYDGLFIKNLENLQGDERDVIFISYTYGKDRQSEKVFQRFGPITFENGWRRLNVLVTRAKRRVEVFSSMDTAEIIGGPDKRGLNSMRDYLEYAQLGGKLVDRGSSSDRPPDSEFEIAVARIIKEMGYDVVPQVGVAGYFIDIGVMRPGTEYEFALGIECDGATYHSAKSVRDRDRIREEVIISRGWKLHRIWSMDWFHNQARETQRLKEAILKAL